MRRESTDKPPPPKWVDTFFKGAAFVIVGLGVTLVVIALLKLIAAILGV